MTSLFKDGALVAKGLVGEIAAQRFLAGLGNVSRVEDVRHVKQWQDVDIDYRAHLLNGSVVSFEVKTDSYIEASQNVAFELGRIHHTAPTPFYVGWGVFSKADFLLVYAPDSQAVYLFRFKLLREAMQHYTHEKRAGSNFKWIASDNTRTTLNVMIPLSEVGIYWRYAALNDGWVMKQGS